MLARRYLLRPAARLRRSRRIATAAPERLWLFDLDNTLHDTSHAIFPLIDRGMTEAVAETLAVDEATANRLRAEYWRRYGATVIGLVRHHGVDADAFLHRSHNFEVTPLVRAEDGCIEYQATTDVKTTSPAQDGPRENVVTVVEKWASVEALYAHSAAPHMGQYREKVKDCVESVKLHVTEPA